jgi:hypothetical protein
MSVTIFADLPEDMIPMKTVRMVDLYPNLTNQDFEMDAQFYGTPKDAEGFYLDTFVDPDAHTEANFANANFDSLMELIDHNMAVASYANGQCGEVKAEDVAAFNAKVMKARNGVLDKAVRPDVHDSNFYTFGITREYIERALNNIMHVCNTAIQHNVSIHWA